MLFGLPIVQITLFGFALTNEIKNARIVVADYAHDETSRQLIQKIAASRYFEIEKSVRPEEMDAAFKTGRIKLAVIFPENFGNDLLRLNKAQLQVIADASDINTANTLTNYLSAIVADFQRERMQNLQVPLSIVPEIRMLYNPELKGEHTFIPGIMAMIML